MNVCVCVYVCTCVYVCVIVAYLTRDVSGTDGVGPRVWWRNGAVIASTTQKRKNGHCPSRREV